jgi:hypothetical protein
MNKEGSFTGYISINGYELTCQVGFQYLDEDSYRTSGGTADQSGPSGVGGSIVTQGLPKTEYLCANTCNKSVGVEFHFEHKGDGEYIITSRDKNFYPGRYLGVNNNNYIIAYGPREESNAFKFKKGDKVLTLNDMPDRFNSGLDMVCRDMRLELHNKKTFSPSKNGNQWAAYFVTYGGDIKSTYGNFLLEIKDRNVE